MWSRTVAVLLFCVCVDLSAFSQRETIFIGADAYQPVPSPDGKLVAFVLTGRSMHGTGGFGRSNLRSNIAFADQNGKNLRDPKVEGFLGEWLPDSSAVSTYRDWHFSLVTPEGSQKNGEIPHQDPPNFTPGPERAQYIPALGSFVWIEYSGKNTYLKTLNGPVATFNRSFQSEALIMPSPDGRYLAIGNPNKYEEQGRNLWIYDIGKATWKDLGPFSVHPDPNWDYIKPNWNPWFADSVHLALVSGSTLCIVRVDGTDRRELCPAQNAGLPVPSPDGKSIAYVTFAPRLAQHRTDLQFWGGSTIWVISTEGGPPRQVTLTSKDETYDLRWLTNSSLIFDRIGEAMFNEHARIWTVPLDLNENSVRTEHSPIKSTEPEAAILIHQ
jgi:WD40 repeat protein